jgi:hypothetical protein
VTYVALFVDCELVEQVVRQLEIHHAISTDYSCEFSICPYARGSPIGGAAQENIKQICLPHRLFILALQRRGHFII